jgi:hypothetical protein
MRGLTWWQKLFQNLRSTGETELMEVCQSGVVVLWGRYSEKVARCHQQSTTDAHFRGAATIPVGYT